MTKVDQNGTTHTYSFDLLGRMTADAVTLASGNPQNVDSSVLRIETSYNTQGLVGTITSFDATTGGNITNQVQNVYSGLGQLTSQFQEHAGAVNTSTSLHVDYGYSDLAHGSRLVSMTYPNGRVLTYNYGTSASLDDSISRLTNLSDGNTTLESYTYLGLGTVIERNHPESGANLTYIKQTGESDGDAGDQYTGLDRFTRVVDQRWIDGSGTALDRYGYSYDRNSNRLTKSNSLNGNLSESYSYDDLNRLANMTRGGSAYQSWDLDGLGNMNSVTTGNVTETRTHNDQNQLTSMGNATLAFDNNGNTVTDDQGHTLVYDAWNRLIAVKSGATLLKSYSYDGQGWRISEAPAGGTTTGLYYSSQWQVLEERQNGNATAQNVWGITYVDQLVLRDRDADQDASHTLEERLYALQDANQNVTAIVTTSGAVAERYVLDSYGVVSVRNADWSIKGDGTVSASTFGWVYLHQGGRYDVVAGEYSFRHRDYSPTTMRWGQVDPYGYINSPSKYCYLGMSPSGRLDPRGLAVERIENNGHVIFHVYQEHWWITNFMWLGGDGPTYLGAVSARSDDAYGIEIASEMARYAEAHGVINRVAKGVEATGRLAVGVAVAAVPGPEELIGGVLVLKYGPRVVKLVYKQGLGWFQKVGGELVKVETQKLIGHCKTYVKKVVSVLHKKNVPFEVLHMQATNAATGELVNDAFIAMEGLESAISSNGSHVGIKVGGMVFDNLHPEGILYEEWIAKFKVRESYKLVIQTLQEVPK